MIFKSKMDKPFKIVFVCVILIVFIILTLPFLFDRANFGIVLVIFLITVFSLFWLATDIVYRFEEDHLYLRAGCLFTRIKYVDISSYRELNGLMDVLSGFNLLSSSKGIAILSDKVMLGEVKISPVNREEFIKELEKRLKLSKTRFENY